LLALEELYITDTLRDCISFSRADPSLLLLSQYLHTHIALAVPKMLLE